MGTIIFDGGLGNQLFQYVFMLYMQETADVKLKYNISEYKYASVHSGFQADRIFSFQDFDEDPRDYYSAFYRLVRKAGRELKHDNNYFFCNDRNFKEGTKHRIYQGFWQNKRFYQAVEKQIQENTLDLRTLCVCPELYGEILKSESVSLHIRRGDYLADSAYYNLAESDYYRKAIAYMRENLKDPVFYVFSDDMAWCRDYFRDYPDFRYIEYAGQSALSDLSLMSSCKNAVIANSSFSWWGAVLGQKKQVIHPSHYYTARCSDDLYFDDWIKV